MSKIWSPDIESGYVNVVNMQKDIIQNNLSFLTNPATINNVVEGTQDAAAGVNRAKQETTTAILTIRQNARNISTIVSKLKEESDKSRATLATKKAEASTLRETVTSAKTIHELRKEQAESLRAKYDGNYHSSWMGLWRPMSDESRMGLFVAAIAFGIIAVFSALYYFKDTLLSWLPASFGGSSAVTATALFGGSVGRRSRM
jgi:hypothetical protein